MFSIIQRIGVIIQEIDVDLQKNHF
jgi:hypothetical protein